MISRHKLDPFTPYQLLPPSYEKNRRATRVAYGWTAANGMLLILLGTLAVVATTKQRRNDQARAKIAAAAFPLYQLRRDTTLLEQTNQQRQDWCQAVESARPDDNGFQTLAAVAASLSADASNIEVDQIAIQIPRERHDRAPNEPLWETGSIDITARVHSIATAHQWVGRLDASDRITNVTLESLISEGGERRIEGQRIEITATPLATRVLP